MEKYTTIFTCLIIFNMLIMLLSFIYIRQSQDKLVCSVNDFLSSLTQFLDHKGAMTFGTTLPRLCEKESIQPHIKKLEKVFHRKMGECRNQRLAITKDVETRPILTLFTSWEPSPEKYFVHNSTVKNWSSFLPKINLVLFTNNSELKKEVSQYGWTVLPIENHVEGVPVLKNMFTTVISLFNSTFYGYSNSDILFVDDLLVSLRVVHQKYQQSNVFLTGRRTNIPHLSLKEVVSYENIKQAATSRGSLFVISSEDYFITTSKFRWDNIPDLVIGRPAYDNWLVGYARCKFYTVIDLTNTVLACHQTTEAGNKEGLKHKNLKAYNHKLLTKLGLITHYETGFIICPKIKTYYSLCGDIKITNRTSQQIPEYCSCKFW